jgi:hypothetical protein
MSVFVGGSAYNMVRDVADGFINVSERTFRKYGPREFAEFAQEVNRFLTEVRSNQPALNETEAIQKRQLRMRRLQQALTIAASVHKRQR